MVDIVNRCNSLTAVNDVNGVETMNRGVREFPLTMIGTNEQNSVYKTLLQGEGERGRGRGRGRNAAE